METLLKVVLNWLWGKIEALLARWKREQELVEDAAKQIAKQSEEKADVVKDAINDHPREPDDSRTAEKLRTGRY